jgi:hypothetical protein
MGFIAEMPTAAIKSLNEALTRFFTRLDAGDALAQRIHVGKSSNCLNGLGVSFRAKAFSGIDPSIDSFEPGVEFLEPSVHCLFGSVESSVHALFKRIDPGGEFTQLWR